MSRYENKLSLFTGRSDLESPSQPNVAAIIIGILLILVIIFGTLLVIVVFVLRSQCHHKNVHETGTGKLYMM